MGVECSHIYGFLVVINCQPIVKSINEICLKKSFAWCPIRLTMFEFVSVSVIIMCKVIKFYIYSFIASERNDR